MKLKIHGASREVGRSCIEAETSDRTRFLFDAGVKLSEHGTEYPATIKDPAGISAVFISHAHLDHAGYLPMLDHNGMKCPIFATAATKEFTRLLLIDAFKIGRLKHEHLGYAKEDIAKAMAFMRRVKTDQKGSVADLKFRYFNAGHIPGSASVLVEADSKKIMYTGDINTGETRLLNGSDIFRAGETDVLITEATYGNREHPNRQQTEKRFLMEIEETIERGGSAIIPVFAVGRAQEIIMLLSTRNFGVPVYLDGMAKKATEITLNFPRAIKDAKRLRSAYNKVRPVRGRIQRKNIEKRQGIFVTTSGMLTGGPIMDYLKHMSYEPRNSILLTGYQASHTNGRMLLEQGSVFLDGWKTRVKCSVKQYDFSAHSGQAQLKKMIRQLNPEKLVINHGDHDAIEDLYEWAEMLDIRVYAPEIGESITL